MARCNHILMNSNTKGGPCCSASIDLNIGCSNKCESCYGKKVSMLPHDQFHTDHPIEKTYDDKEFRKSVKKYVNKGIKYARSGKFSDITRGNLGGTFNQVLESTRDEGMRLVCVTKSLTYNTKIGNLLRNGNHVLHVSLGMISEARSNAARLKTATAYHNHGVNTKIRIVEDMTKEMPVMYRGFRQEQVILTPLRLNCKEDCVKYGVNMDNYTFDKGYYRPNFLHDSWNNYPNICGEVNGELKCCSCLVN